MTLFNDGYIYLERKKRSQKGTQESPINNVLSVATKRI
jgi:hypothetical protein